MPSAVRQPWLNAGLTNAPTLALPANIGRSGRRLSPTARRCLEQRGSPRCNVRLSNKTYADTELRSAENKMAVHIFLAGTIRANLQRASQPKEVAHEVQQGQSLSPHRRDGTTLPRECPYSRRFAIAITAKVA